MHNKCHHPAPSAALLVGLFALALAACAPAAQDRSKASFLAAPVPQLGYSDFTPPPL